jgi:predicted TIM-barrel fold metal-dependent hydrolase
MKLDRIAPVAILTFCVAVLLISLALPVFAQTKAGAQGKPETAAKTGAERRAAKAQAPQTEAGADVLLKDYAPRSKLVVKSTRIEHARFPVIDVHLHLDPGGDPQETALTMSRLNLQTIVCLGTGDMRGEAVKKFVEKWVKPSPGRFGVMANLDGRAVNDPDFSSKAVAQLREDVKNGALGLKIFKQLGLVWRDTQGRLIRPDDPRFDPVWDACAELHIPVLIHVNDVSSFFDPVDRFNERYLSLTIDRRSSWYGKVDVTHEQLMDWFENIIAKHPKTTFIGAHVGMHYEHLYTGARWLDTYPNLYYDISASCKHLGRQPYTARKFLIKYQDRILFGCDIGKSPQPEVYQYMFRVLETDDEYFDHVEPSAGLPWKIYGLYLPDQVLEKIYSLNAKKLYPQFRRAAGKM